ncbi:hypothetical protein [Embleya scabrispora]|uniref:hypothetical protein n=1 Tax=Embleya scabrispora TaxID=159449 RepID=UPI00038021B6|nr:hypothetical protein [Embleya scabrispora]MYS83043.1 hypothetical protein [Streptomyces sp. SID5474]
MTRLRRIPVLAAVVLMCATGCSVATDVVNGTSSESTSNATLSDAKLRARIKAIVSRVHSVHAVVDFARDGRVGVRADARFDVGTRNFTARLEASGVTVEVVAVGADVYVKAPRIFWRSALENRDSRDEETITELTGPTDKYAHLLRDDPLRARLLDDAEFYNPRTFLEGLSEATRRADPGSENPYSVVFEQAGGTGRARLYIPATGRPLPERVTVARSVRSTLAVTWSDYDKPVPVKAPAADRVVEMRYRVSQAPPMIAPTSIAYRTWASPAG